MTGRFLVLFVALAAPLAACSNDAPILNDSGPVDVAPPTDTPDAAPVCTGGSLNYLDTCDESNSMCGSCDCFSFGHDVICTITCTGNSDCPAPSAGCIAGHCRPPA